MFKRNSLSLRAKLIKSDENMRVCVRKKFSLSLGRKTTIFKNIYGDPVKIRDKKVKQIHALKFFHALILFKCIENYFILLDTMFYR